MMGQLYTFLCFLLPWSVHTHIYPIHEHRRAIDLFCFCYSHTCTRKIIPVLPSPAPHPTKTAAARLVSLQPCSAAACEAKAASMKESSLPPSSTDAASPTSTPVRWSFTIWYGCRT
jgi:hypothetical protein